MDRRSIAAKSPSGCVAEKGLSSGASTCILNMRLSSTGLDRLEIMSLNVVTNPGHEHIGSTLMLKLKLDKRVQQVRNPASLPIEHEPLESGLQAELHTYILSSRWNRTLCSVTIPVLGVVTLLGVLLPDCGRSDAAPCSSGILRSISSNGPIRREGCDLAVPI